MSPSKRLLVLAGAAVTDIDEVPSSVRVLVDAADEVFVSSNATLTSRLEWLVSDVDNAHRAADERLDAVLGQLRSVEVAAEGTVGDDTPLTAIADHVRAFEPDHIVIALRSADHAGWQERGLAEQTERTFHLPVTSFEGDPEGHVVARARVSRDLPG